MQKIFGFILILMIGLAVGVFVGVMLPTTQNPLSSTEVSVTIEDIMCNFTNNADAELEVVLEDVRARTENLRGEVTIFQDGDQWTSEVDWRYTGYGFAKLNCSTLSEDGDFRIKYTEYDSGVTYLDRIIEWSEVDVTHIMGIEQLEIRGCIFSGISGDAANTIVLTVKNTGTVEVTADKYKLGVSGTQRDIPDVLVSQGATTTVTCTTGADGQPWINGITYDIYLITSSGKQYMYRATAP